MNRRLLAAVFLVVSTPSWAACQATLRSFKIYDAKGAYLGLGQVHEYKPEGEPRPGRVLVLPTTNGENTIDRLYAREMCRTGYSTQGLISWPESKFDFLDPRMHNDFLKRVRYAVKALLGRSQAPVALIGTSLGGIAGSSLIAVKPRIRVAVLIATGAHINEIISVSDHPKAVEQTEGSMKRYHLKTHEDFAEFLGRYVNQDPSDLLPRAEHLPDTLHFLTTLDTTVPTKNQKELIALFPNPTVIQIRANHFYGIIETSARYGKTIRNFIVSHMPEPGDDD
ncbi:MAG: hypothetical protein ABIO95_03950 [Bdellovibrionota bacterium]